MKLLKKVLISLGIFSCLATSSFATNSVVNDPIFRDFQKLQEDMNKIFDNFHSKFFNNMRLDDEFFKNSSFTPRSDLIDKGKYYEIKVDLPGVDQAQTKVEVKDHILSIDAKSEKAKEEKSDKLIKKERFVGVFHKSLTLPKDANGDKLTTQYKNGVLTIKIPKK